MFTRISGDGVKVMRNEYRDLERFSGVTGIPPDALILALEIERAFHKDILEETSFERRKEMYRKVYQTVHAVYGKARANIHKGPNPKDRIANLFRKELEGKSVLDVGCGEGYFLSSVASRFIHGRLVGLDVSIPELSKHAQIEFVSHDIIEFDMGEQFDVVFSDQVLEHIAPADLKTHLRSVRKALKDGGTFVILMPNRLFGPSDVSRIMDFSYSGETEAQGTHLHESTYAEMTTTLEGHGFRNLKTVLPILKRGLTLGSFRMDASILARVEKSPILMHMLHHLRFREQCLLRLEVIIIATAS